MLVARREDRLRTLADEIGGEVEVCDVGDREAVEAMAERVLERHPAIDLLVNNAGMPARGTFLTVDPDLIRRVIEVNYLGGVWCTRALLPGLKWGAADGGSHVVNLVSVAGTVAFAPAGAYAASKHAQLAFSRSLAAAPEGNGDPGALRAPGLRRDGGLPAEGRAREPAPEPVRDPPAAGRGGGRRARSRRASARCPCPGSRTARSRSCRRSCRGLMARFVGVSGLPPRLGVAQGFRATYQPISTSKTGGAIRATRSRSSPSSPTRSR